MSNPGETASTTPPQQGDRLGHYRLVKNIAVGGVGTVYQAQDEGLNRMVALKVLAPELMADKAFVDQFWQEAKLLAALTHPHIIQIYFIGTEKGRLFYAMELVDGFNLESLLTQHKQFNTYEAVEFIRQAALGLQYAHNHGVIHRDIKPANLLATRDGVIKVGDFGLARDIHAATVATDRQFFLGTPDYVSPEEASGLSVDHRGDIYSLGTTLYHFVAGRPPYQGTPHDVLRQHCESRPPRIQQLNPQAPLGLNAILDKMMAPERDDRYQNYAELLEDIDKFLASRPRTRPHSVPPARSPQPVATPKPPPKSAPIANWLIAVSLTLLAVVFIWKQISSLPDRTPPPPTVETPPEPSPVEREAADKWAEINPQVEKLKEQARYGEAVKLLDTWPTEKFVNTPSHKSQRAARAQVVGRAAQACKKAEADALQLARDGKFDDALAIIREAAPNLAGIAEFELQMNQTEQFIRSQLLVREREQETIRLATEREQRKRFKSATAAIERSIVTLQFEQAQLDLFAMSGKIDPSLTQLHETFRRDLDGLSILKRKVMEQIQGNPYHEFSLAVRNSKIQGALSNANATQITIRQKIESGAVGEIVVPWSDLSATDTLRILRHYIDAADKDGIWSLCVLATLYAEHDKLTPNAVRQWLDKFATADPVHEPDFATLRTRLDDLAPDQK
jgi:serine/threonine protein kinase